ncbi:MAG TPA: hypothetical protein VMZ91_04360 [Candidatus Paceibacterota bacterium]|nr:hypothetical protein [Candidatus Paceibacterota bacterium]
MAVNKTFASFKDVFKDLKTIKSYKNLLDFNDNAFIGTVSYRIKAAAVTNQSYEAGERSLRIEKKKVSPKLYIAHIILDADCMKPKKAREVLTELSKKYPKKYYKK